MIFIGFPSVFVSNDARFLKLIALFSALDKKSEKTPACGRQA